MLKIGLKPVEISSGVEVKVTRDNLYTVKGLKGELVEQVPKEMIIKVEDNITTASRPSEIKRRKSFHGLTRTLVSSMVEGVTKGYKKTLIVEGIGYRAAKQGRKLVLNLGYSHTIEKEDPEGISIEVPGQYILIISGINKQQVGNYAARIGDSRRPESCKGKGIRHEDGHARRKIGKTGK